MVENILNKGLITENNTYIITNALKFQKHKINNFCFKKNPMDSDVRQI